VNTRWARRRCVAAGFLVAAAGIGALGACGSGGTSVDAEAIGDLLIERSEPGLPGAEFGEAECPGDLSVDEGDTFVCTLVIDGQSVDYRVTRTDSGYDFALDGKVLAQPVSGYEDAAAAFVLANEGVDVAADCGERAWVFVSERTSIDCTVDYGDLPRGVEVGIARNGEVRNVVFTQARLDLAVVTTRVSQQLIDELGGPFVVTCDPPLVDETGAGSFDPGATFACTAIRSFAEVGTIDVEVVDVNGKLRATLRR
jgi:hypothetical protein